MLGWGPVGLGSAAGGSGGGRPQPVQVPRDEISAAGASSQAVDGWPDLRTQQEP